MYYWHVNDKNIKQIHKILVCLENIFECYVKWGHHLKKANFGHIQYPVEAGLCYTPSTVYLIDLKLHDV